MKVYFFLIIYIHSILIKYSNGIKLKQIIQDNQYPQAQVPPLISVLMNVPAYGRNDLYAWDGYIEANKQLIKEAEHNKLENAMKNYSARFDRIGKLKNKLENTIVKKVQVAVAKKKPAPCSDK